MGNINIRQLLSAILALSLFAAISPLANAQYNQSSNNMLPYQPLSDSALDSLLAPIALYPDPLLAEVLQACEHMDQIASAQIWVENNPSLQGIDMQIWDPSVMAVAHYPSVLNKIASQGAWGYQVGQAFQNQQSAVFASVQRLRSQAQAAGYLSSTPQQTIVTNNNVIQILPAQQSVIYVPQYNPTVVYTTPVVPPTSPAITFGTGFMMGSAMSYATMGWSTNTVMYYPPPAALYAPPPSGVYKTGTTVDGGQMYAGYGPHGYGQGVTNSGTGAYGNTWNSAAVAGRTWNGGAYAGTAHSNEWANGATTGSYSASGVGPYGSAQAHGVGYQDGDSSAGAFSKSASDGYGAVNVSGSGWKDSDGSSGSVTATGVNRSGNYYQKTWNDSDGSVSSTTNSGNAFSQSNRSAWANSYSDRGSYSRAAGYGGGWGGGGGYDRGAGYGGGGFGGGGFGGFRR